MKPENPKVDAFSPNKRKAQMNKIRKSLQNTPICRQNLTNTRRFTLISTSRNNLLEQPEASIDLDASFEQGKQKASIGNFQIFQEKYETFEKLGEGTNGVVKRCKKKLSGEEYAVKSFTFEEEHLPGLKANFLMLKRLRHPSIIKYQALYIDIKKRLAWLVMELIEAPSFEKVLLNQEEDIKNVMFQLLESLNYLHKNDIVHRDIKPDNILYDPITKKIKLIDFGISKRFKRRGQSIEMWTITGTLYYRAPEMFSGGYREGVDVWSAGVLLFKFITRKTPFESQYHNETIKRIREKELEFPIVFENYTCELKDLISKILDRNTEERPTAQNCLKHRWFSSMLESSPNGKSEKLCNEPIGNANGACKNKNKFRMKIALSLNVALDEFMSLSTFQQEDSLISVRPYVCKVNGQEFHCIDSEWK